MTKILLPPPPTAATLLNANSTEQKLYWDRSYYDFPETQMKNLSKSSTLYIGILSFTTRSHHLHAHFATIGPIQKIHMGLSRFQKTPCGFAFIEYAHRHDALNAISYLSGTKLNGRVIRVELDAGFIDGRQYGRGPSGGQVRDDRRGTIDSGRSSSMGKKGITGDRWKAPPSSSGGGENDGANVGYYGSGTNENNKRTRDDDDDDGNYSDNQVERSNKHSRFNEEEEDW